MMETTPAHAWIARRRYDTMWPAARGHSIGGRGNSVVPRPSLRTR